MDIEEAYVTMQQACGIEGGDKVRVLRKATFKEMGWKNSWAEGMDKLVGNVYEVGSAELSDRAGIMILLPGDYWWLPFFVLEVVEKPPKKKEIVVGDKTIRISEALFDELKAALSEE